MPFGKATSKLGKVSFVESETRSGWLALAHDVFSLVDLKPGVHS